MDISGGMPAVVIKMLVSSEPGTIRLLPALPGAWPTGTIEGVLCRGGIEVRRLHWTPEVVECTLRSAVDQTVLLELPAAVSSMAVKGRGSQAVSAGPCRRRLTLPAAREVSMTIRLNR